MGRIDEMERVRAGFLGLAIGDALGVPVEFVSREELATDPVTGMRRGGVWNQEAGTWSDDTSLALCLAQSIVDRGFDPEDFGRRAVAWLDEGYWSACGLAFDVGGATRRSLERIRSGMPAVLAGGRGENDNGNGSLMRVLPASVWLALSPEPLRFRAIAALSAPTHGHPRSILGCWLYSLVVAELLTGSSPRQAYRAGMESARRTLPTLPAGYTAEAEIYSRVLDGALAALPRSAIRGSGYVVHCLEAALWCLLNSDDFSSCVLNAINLGEDCDTTAAVAGGLAGLVYGDEAIPREWRGVLPRLAEIEALAERLGTACSRPLPFEGAYWVLPGKLLAGPYPLTQDLAQSRSRLEALKAAGVTARLDLTEEDESLPGGELRSDGTLEALFLKRRVPLHDRGAEHEAAGRAVGEIDSLLEAGNTVYVHCHGGIGRTGMVIAGWLISRGLAAPSETLDLLASLRLGAGARFPSPETAEQEATVRSFRPGPKALPL